MFWGSLLPRAPMDPEERQYGDLEEVRLNKYLLSWAMSSVSPQALHIASCMKEDWSSPTFLLELLYF